MAKILKVKGRQVFDSRGNPTVEAEIILNDGVTALTIVPSGASTGAYEAFELRDKKNFFMGKSVYSAVNNINTIIAKKSIIDIVAISNIINAAHESAEQ